LNLSTFARRHAIAIAVAVPAMFCAAEASAMAIDHALFREWGGDPDDPVPTAETALKRVRDAASKGPLLAAGRLIRHDQDSCGGTWLGEDTRFTYVLATKTHCGNAAFPELSPQAGQADPPRFFAWDGTLVAQGLDGLEVAPDGEVAVYRLKRLATPKDRKDRALQPAVIHDGDFRKENGLVIRFVSYVQPVIKRGVDRLPMPTTEASPAPTPRTAGEMRAVDTDRRFLRARGRTTPFGSVGGAWWARIGGRPVIVAVSSTQSERGVSLGRRVAPQAEWLMKHAPMVRTTSGLWTVTNGPPMRSPNFLAGGFDQPAKAVYFTVPEGQEGALGITQRLEAGDNSFTFIQVNARNEESKDRLPLRLRAHKVAGCDTERRRVKMESAFQCEGAKRSRLVLSFRYEDNPGLEKVQGHYQSQFDLVVHREGERASSEFIPVRVDIQFVPSISPT
jgi:hypothetical protein